MKETGIIMSGNHPNLILKEEKTMTRRTAGLKRVNNYPDRYSNPMVYKGITGDWFVWFEDANSTNPTVLKCPFGGLGDLLWVRETALYWVSPVLEGVQYDKPSDWWSSCVYQDDTEIAQLLEDNKTLRATRDIHEAIEGSKVIGKWEWKSSIHMPRFASRQDLVITGLRAERLQDITPEDAKKEGLDFDNIHPVNAFFLVWNKLNAKRGYGWDFNPWVWVILFKLLKESRGN